MFFLRLGTKCLILAYYINAIMKESQISWSFETLEFINFVEAK